MSKYNFQNSRLFILQFIRYNQSPETFRSEQLLTLCVQAAAG